MKFDTLSPKYWFSTFIPGLILAFDLVMSVDLFPIKVVAQRTMYSTGFWISMFVIAIVLGQALSFIVYMFLKARSVKSLVERFAKFAAMKTNRNPDIGFFIQALFFANLVLPTLLFGALYPAYEGNGFLQPYFFFMISAAAVLFAILTLFALALEGWA